MAKAADLNSWGFLCWEFMQKHLSELISTQSYHEREESMSASEPWATAKAIVGPVRRFSTGLSFPQERVRHVTLQHSLPHALPSHAQSKGQEPDPSPQGCQVGFLTQERHSIPNN